MYCEKNIEFNFFSSDILMNEICLLFFIMLEINIFNLSSLISYKKLYYFQHLGYNLRVLIRAKYIYLNIWYVLFLSHKNSEI